MVAVVAVLLAGAGSAAFAGEPAKGPPVRTKQYEIELRVCQGDPLGSQAEGNVQILTRTAVMTLEGQTAQVQVGPGPLAPDGLGKDVGSVSLQVVPVSEKDGTIRLELGCSLSERTEPTNRGRPVREVSAHAKRDVAPGELFRMR